MTPELAKNALILLSRSKLEGNLPQQLQEAAAAQQVIAALEAIANPQTKSHTDSSDSIPQASASAAGSASEAP